MFEPARGGTRGGQAEFKWSDVSADKDRENYLGHSINAPTGRWQKNQDVHWYNRDLKQTETEREAEIRKVKEAEEDALAVALGFAPAVRNKDSQEKAPSNSGEQPGAAKSPDDVAREAEKAERRQRKLEKRLKKAEKKARREMRGGVREPDSAGEDGDARRRGLGRGGRSRSRSRSRPRPQPRSRSRSLSLSRSRSPRRRSRERDGHRGDLHSLRSPAPRRRSRTPPRDSHATSRAGPYDERERERERERVRRQWDTNAKREQPGGRWGHS